MFKKLSLTIFAICVLLSSNVHAQNLLDNPNFENGLASWSISGPNWVAQTDVVFPDSGLISAQNTILSPIPGQDYFSSIFQTKPASSGETIYATLQTKTAIDVTSFAVAGLLVEFLDGSNNVIGTAQDQTGGQTDWKNLYVTATAPSGTVNVRFRCFIFASQAESSAGGVALGSDAFYDQAVLSKSFIAPPPDPTLLVNPSFENGFTDWGLVFPAVLPSVTALEVDDQIATAGTYSAKFNFASTIIDYFASASQDLAYISGPVWASSDIKTVINPASSGLAELRLEFYDKFNPITGVDLPLSIENVQVSGINQTKVVLDGGGSGITPPVGTVMIRVVVLTYALASDPLSPGGTANFDDVVLSYSPITAGKKTDLVNKGFENGLDQWGDLFGFPATISSPGFGGSFFAAQKTIGQLVGQDYFSQVFQEVFFNAAGDPFPNDVDVFATAFAKTNQDPTVPSISGLQVELIDDTGVVVDIGTDFIGGQTDWRYLFVKTTTPETGTISKIRISGFQFASEADSALGGDALYDDFDYSLGVSLAPPPPQTDLINPGFENGNHDWDQDNTPPQVSLNPVFSGNFASEFEVDGTVLSQNYFGSASQDLVVGDNDRINFEAYVKTNLDPLATSVATVTVEFYDADGAFISGQTDPVGISGVTDWTLIRLDDVPIPSTAVTARVICSLFVDSPSATPATVGGKAWFDDADVEFEKGPQTQKGNPLGSPCKVRLTGATC